MMKGDCFYFCGECGHVHRDTSVIGKKHIGFKRTVSSQYFAGKISKAVAADRRASRPRQRSITG